MSAGTRRTDQRLSQANNAIGTKAVNANLLVTLPAWTAGVRIEGRQDTDEQKVEDDWEMLLADVCNRPKAVHTA